MYLAQSLRISYSDFHSMPTYVRKYIINKLIDNNTPD
jgi:hypothetical protein